MEVHGRDAGKPRRIGLDVASVAAGLLAAQGVIAAELARSRGLEISRVETSVLQSCLLLISHYVAVATCLEDAPHDANPAPGPPFRTSDGHWFEMETLDPDAWRSFWFTLGYVGPDLGRAWTAFRMRYNRGACSLPHGLHEATQGRTLAEVAKVADDCGVSLSPLRSYSEVLVEPGLWEGHPLVEPVGGPIGGLPPAPGGNRTDGAAGARAMAPGDEELPLSGLRVVEATNRVQGPLAGQLLRMLGADVVLVEPPGGDPARMGTPAAGDTGAFFLCFNRGKQPTELDLNTPAGRAGLVELASGADVFLHNWRPGKAAHWGLEHEDLIEHNSRLVYAEASGWGRAAQPRHLMGTDFMVQAYAGVGNGINPVDERPFPTRALLTDYLGGLVACEGVLAGLHLRERTSQGCRVETSLLAGAMALQFPVLEAMAGGRADGRHEGRPVWGPLDRPLEAADGFVVMSVGDGAPFVRLCTVLDVDPDRSPRPVVEERLAGQIRARPSSSLEELLNGAGIPCAAARSDLSTLPGDPHLTQLFDTLGGTSQVPASPWRFST